MKPGLPRLAVLSHSAVEGSHQRKWEAVSRLGWRVLLLVPSRWQEGSRWIAGRPRRSGRLEVRTLGGLWTGRLARWIPFGLGRQLASFSPDLVLAEEEYFSFSCLSALRASRRLGVPFAFFTWENIHRRYRRVQEYLSAGILRGASGAVAGNAEAVRVLRRRGFRGPVAVVPQYGVDPRAFRPRPRGACRRELKWPSRGFVAGYVGRLVREKGIDTLFRAVALLGPGARLAVVGAGEARPELAGLARRLPGLRVDFMPAVPRGRIAAVMGALDVLVLPSRTTPAWKEQFGRVLVEALACGRPALGSDSGEIPGVLGDRRLVFPEGDHRALARLLRGASRGRLRRLVPSARRRALSRFSEEAVAVATHRFLRRLVDTAKKPR